MSQGSRTTAADDIDRMAGCNSVAGTAVAAVQPRGRVAGAMPAPRRLPGMRWVEDLPPYVSPPSVAGDGAGLGKSDRVTGGGALAVCPGVASVSLSDGTRLSFIAISHLMPELTDTD